MDSILKVNLKHKKQLIENNKLLEKGEAIEVIEGLQMHKDKRVWNASIRLISNNLDNEE
jgi:hypothetical protein